MNLPALRLSSNGRLTFIALLCLLSSSLAQVVTSNCWWSGCQPSSWAVRGCPQNFTETQNEACEDGDSTKYKCCENGAQVPTTTPAVVFKDCWWSGCQPSTWAVRGCPQDRTSTEEKKCEDGDSLMYHCCLEERGVTPTPTPAPTVSPPQPNLASCWWSGCQPTEWAVRGCPKTMVQVDSDSCGNDTFTGDMYRCCDPAVPSTDDETPNSDDGCWWTSCKPLDTVWTGCPNNSVSIDVESCGGGSGNQYQCCSKVPGAKNEDLDVKNFDYYKNYVRYLLLKANDFEIIPDSLKCKDLDPEKSYIFTLEGDEENGIKVCDMCPNFPMDKLANVVLNTSPFSVTENTDLGDCFGDCYTTDQCVAFSFDQVAKTCYIFNTTIGKFEQEDDWTTVLINQPVGLVQKWLYSRHSLITGTSLKIVPTQSFILCLNECEQTPNCNHVSYNFDSKRCSLFDGINGTINVDLQYGSVLAYNLQAFKNNKDIEWRFTEDIATSDVTIDDETSKVPEKANNNCPKPKEESLDSFFASKCTTSGGLGCDSSTGCLTCYYPEIAQTYRTDLTICPESSVITGEVLRNKLQSCFAECFSSKTCIGVDFSSLDVSCDYLSLDQFFPDAGSGVRRYLLQFPSTDDATRSSLSMFTVVPNQLITPGSKTWSRSLSTQNWNYCLNECLKSDLCEKASYSSSKKSCILASSTAGIRDNREDKSMDYQTFLRKPTLNSPLLPYKSTPGYIFDPNNSKFDQTLDCRNQDCSSQIKTCIDTCTNRLGSFCEHVSVEYLTNSLRCRFYDWKDNVTLSKNANGEVFTVKFSDKTLNLDILNNLTSFQLQDLSACFQDNDGQSQGTLVANDQVFDFASDTDDSTSRSVRRRRNIFKKIWNGLKKIGKAIVDTVKDTVKGVVDTVKNVGKTIGKVVKGDFKGAKEAFLDIPIVKTVKETGENVVKLGKSIVKGNWNEAKDAALGIASGGVLDFIPVGGKFLSAGGKILKNAVGKGAKNVQKDVGKKAKENVGKNVNKNRDTNNKGDTRKKPDDKPDPDAPNRCRRAAIGAKRTKPGTTTNSCNNNNSKKRNTGSCEMSKGKGMPNLLDPSDCKVTKSGGSCSFECDIGYEENPVTLKCNAVKSGKPQYVPKPSCKEETCAKGPYPLIPVKVPSPISIAGRRTRISAYVLKVDKRRRLPIWSLAYQTSLNNKKKLNQKRKSSFYQFPCLDRSQPRNEDFPKQAGSYKTIHKGHLTPANVMLFTNKAAAASNLYINTAPQDGFTNSVFWLGIESQVECFTNRVNSLVLTGLCPGDRGKTNGGLDIPDCYWKMVCYRKPEDGKTVVIGFVSNNTKILPSDTRARALMKEQLSNPVSQSLIKTRMAGSGDFVTPWVRGGQYVFVGRADLGKKPLNPVECEAATNADQKEVDMWEKNVRGGKGKKKAGGRRRRDVLDQNTRGCTAAEAQRLAAFLGLGSIFLDDLDENPPDDDSDDDDEPQGDGGNLVPAAKCNKRMIGYYPSWGKGKFSYKQAQRLTHIVYAFLEMKPDGTIAVGNPDPNNALNSDEVTATATNKLQQLMRVAKEFSHLKVMFAVGGWENSQYFSAVAASPQKRLTFIASVIQNIDEWEFDGVDIDWEYPVTGGAHEGVPSDKQNYVQLMKELRETLDQHAQAKGRSGNPYLLSFAGAAGQWTLDPGFDLPGLLKYANWVNVMTYDFFGAWASDWGAYTGPPAPLYFGMPKRYSGKTNVAWTMKYYSCRSLSPHQITMGVPFYGRYWKNVGPPVDGQDGMWRHAVRTNGIFEGGYAGWKEILEKYIPNPAFQKLYHEKVQAPYAWNEAEKIYLGYENDRSLKEKAIFAAEKNLGGLMIWAIDQDDSDLSMLNTIYGTNLCGNTDPKDVKFKCSPITEKRWWTSEDGDDVAGLCGRSAPLYKGYYPVCDPDDPGYSCCGAFGYCGSGDEFCNCPTCINYADDPQKILEPPSKPTVPVQWYFLNAADGKRGRCGRKAPKLNGDYPICNPDDKNAHCCSNGNYCGNGKGFCECEGCIDFAKNPAYKFKPKRWWDWSDGAEKSGKCGDKAPKVDGFKAECDPDTKYYCCSASGNCGEGPDFCDCKGCVNYKKT